MKLSERRAESVSGYLVKEGHIPQNDIVTIGKGESNPTYPNTPATRYKNRRVDLEFLTYVSKEELVPVQAATPVASQQQPRQEPPIVWHSEMVEPEPAWIQHGLFDTISHKRTVDYYRVTTQTVTTSTARAFVNRSPVANNDSYTVQTGIPMSMAVLANDSDPDNDALTITSVAQPALGKVTISGSSVVYTPNSASLNGMDSFSYTVSDGKGGTASATVAVTLATNQAPVAVPDQYHFGVGTYNLNVLANDYDPDGDPLSIVSFTQPGYGVLSLNGSSLLYSFHTSYTATTFSYTISDGRGGSSSAIVTLVDP
jgi:hypothetical protein